MQAHTFLGFDFGKKYIGVATGQLITRSARPLTSLKAHNGVPNWKELDTLIKEWAPAALIVGIPLNMDGTTQPITHLARAFKEELVQRFKLPVYEVDERLTTRAAREHLFEEGGYKNLEKTKVDQYAAKLILESWLGSAENPFLKS